VDDVMLVEDFSRLCSHDSIVESAVTSGLYIGRRADGCFSRTGSLLPGPVLVQGRVVSGRAVSTP
jgi:hypothetical protein